MILLDFVKPSSDAQKKNIVDLLSTVFNTLFQPYLFNKMYLICIT